MGISRRSEVAWHLRMGNLPLLHVDPKLHERLDSLTRRYEGESGMAALFPHATVTPSNGQEFEALALRTYAGDVRISRILMTPCTIKHHTQTLNSAPSRGEALTNDRVQLSAQYGGTSMISSGDTSVELPLGAGKYTCSRYRFEITYSGLSDLLLASLPISRLPDLADALRSQPAAMFPQTATTEGTFAFLARFLFRRLTESRSALDDESTAENALVSLTRSALIPALQKAESRASDPEVQRIVNAEIEAHHRDSALTVDSIASLVGMSRRQLYRVTGTQLAKKLDRRRSQSARELIEADPHLDLTVIANLSGFTNATRLRDNFVRAYGILPSEFRASVRKRHLGTNKPYRTP